jgi:hypothetical protein
MTRFVAVLLCVSGLCLTVHGAKRAKDALAAPPVQVARAMDEDAREKFLEIERIARLPDTEQAEEVPRFYRELAPRYMSPVIEMILSSYRENILDSTKFGFPGGDHHTAWAQQMTEAESELTPEEVADKMGGGLWLNVAARVRAIQILKEHEELTAELIEQDLDSGGAVELGRACGTIGSLEIITFTDRLLSLYMESDGECDHARNTLLFLGDDSIIEPLMERVKAEPEFLSQCAGFFQSSQWREPADPLFLTLLDSSDAEIRYAAVRAVYECSDPKLAEHVVKMAGEEDVRMRSAAAYLGGNLPTESFAVVRKDLLQLLRDDDESIRVDAIVCFSHQEDPAAGPVIVEMLNRDEMSEQHKVYIMQSMHRLVDDTCGYYMHEWGPNRRGNLEAIQEFEERLVEMNSL